MYEGIYMKASLQTQIKLNNHRPHNNLNNKIHHQNNNNNNKMFLKHNNIHNLNRISNNNQRGTLYTILKQINLRHNLNPRVKEINSKKLLSH